MPVLLQINVDATNGSNGGVVFGINDLVVNKGWDSYIAYGRNSIERDNAKIIPIGDKWNVYWHGIESRLFDNHGLSSRIATKCFLKVVDELKPDIVHLHNIHGYFVNYRLLFEYLSDNNIPTVWTLHDCWGFTGHCAHFVSAKCDKWKTECRNCPLKNHYPKSMLFDNCTKNFRLKKHLFARNTNLHIVTVSNWLEGLAKQSLFKDCDIRVIHNGIDLEQFKPYEDEPSDKFIVMGVAATWSEGKGLNDYIKLSEILDDRFVIVLVGVTDEIRKKLPQRIIGVKKTDSIEQLAKYYSHADVVTSLSYAESLGMTPIEGMACGTPAIVYDNTAQPELINNECGKIVPTGDIYGVYKAILEITNKGRSHYSEICRNLVKMKYDMNDRYSDYLSLYEEILNKK